MGVSVDHVPALMAWAKSLGDISFPLLSDFWPHGAAAEAWGVFRHEDGHSERALFILDAEGIVRYVDVHDIADQPDNETLFAELAKLEPESAGRLLAAESSPQTGSDAPVSPDRQETLSDGVLMYCRSWCPDCRRARDWLDREGISYVEIDVDQDAVARERAASHNEGRLHTPTFEIGEEVCVDFQPQRIRQLLDMM